MGSWRVGGILSLSRAFGDAFLKANLEFEGIDSGEDYRTGFGVIAEPDVSLTDLKSTYRSCMPASEATTPRGICRGRYVADGAY